MKGFYIKEITADGANVRSSTVSFNRGLNIICGPSNTGKSYILNCIDFLFGAKDPPSISLGDYDTITMKIETIDEKEIQFKRKIDSNNIEVISDSSEIESKVYKIGGNEGKKEYSDIFLRLIGIQKRPKIYISEKRKANDLTWRSFCHTFYIDEETIIKKESILYPAKGYSPTRTLSCLLFLITGKDIVNRESRENIDIKNAKKDAVKIYINEKLINSMENSKEVEEKLQAYENIDFDSLIQSMTDEIKSIEEEIIKANNESRQILRDAYTVSADLEEAKLLKERYTVLMSQYKSDEDRLNFIVEGEENKEHSSKKVSCPLCNSKVSICEHVSYREAAESEFSKLQLQKQDLELAMDDITNEIQENEEKLKILNEKNSRVLDLINHKLTPKIEGLKDELIKAQRRNDMLNQLNIYRDIMNDLNSDLNAQEQEEVEVLYKPLKLLPSSFFTKLNEYLDDILKKTSYPSYQTSRIPSDSANNMDIVVNGQAKKFQGKGYRAYLNTIYGFILMKYLSLSSPLIALSEYSRVKYGVAW